MKPKTLTFNLCDHDSLNLTFTNRKGLALYSISFLRPYAIALRKPKKENEESRQELQFTHYNRSRNPIETVRIAYAFRTKHAPRVPDAKTHEQRITLSGELAVSIEGADGLQFAAFFYARRGEQVQFNTLQNEDGSGYGFTHFPPDSEFKTRRERKVAK